MSNPRCILVFSGKRKSGKDYLADLLHKRFGEETCQVLRLSGPLKKQFAEENGLDYSELLNASSYKEIYRAKMIRWGDDKRHSDPYFFCEKSVAAAECNIPLWIISDARRKSDIQFFREKFSNVAKLVRITASESVRIQRGFVFTQGVDDAESECGLDSGVQWDFIVNNDIDKTVFDSEMKQIVNYVTEVLAR